MSDSSPSNSGALYQRRSFLKHSAFSAAFLGLGQYLRAISNDQPQSRVIEPYGPLRPDPEGILDLPKGFRYRIIARQGAQMSDGFRTPAMPDDMAAFEGRFGRVVLVCNHEIGLGQPGAGPFETSRFPEDLDPDLSYDPGSDVQAPYLGGTTTIVYNPRTGKAEKQFLSLTGTDRNCSGGATPWNSWITCEEPGNLTSPRGRKHGYCFEVKADPESGLQKAVALTGMGRFRHEAVSYDLVDDTLYLTEDRNDGLLYRFVPDKKRDFSSGKLYALALVQKDSADLRNYNPGADQVKEGEIMEVEWIEVEDVEAPDDDLRFRGYSAGAARFARGEGIFFSESDNAHYICCTDGGPERRGQIYRLLPRHFGDTRPGLELFLQPGESDLLTNGDNLCISNNGDLVICEDLVGKYGRSRPHLRGITPEGEIYTLARNARNSSEFAGTCFAPDGKTLFVNMQGLGLTLAITGPFRA